jgi:hypothetical protein
MRCCRLQQGQAAMRELLLGQNCASCSIGLPVSGFSDLPFTEILHE